MKTITQTALAMVVGAALAGCSGSTATNGSIMTSAETTELFIATQQQVAEVDARLEQAIADNLTYFAPALYKDAYGEWDDANDAFEKLRAKPEKTTAKSTAKIAGYLQVANQLLDDAYKIKQTSESTLAESFSLMNRLQELETQNLFAKKFKTAQGLLDNMVEDIADGDLEDATEAQPEAIEYMTALEVETVEHIELSDFDAELEALEDNDIEDTAPLSYQRAVKKLGNAREVIAFNPRDVESIAEAVAAVKFEIDHTEFISRSVVELEDEKASYESVLIDFEEHLKIISTYLAGVDYRDQPIQMQVAFIARDAEKQGELVVGLQDQVATLEQQVEYAVEQGYEIAEPAVEAGEEEMMAEAADEAVTDAELTLNDEASQAQDGVASETQEQFAVELDGSNVNL